MKTKGLNTKTKLIQCAIKLLYEQGYSALTTSKLAQEAGISQPATYKYFKGKVEILAACASFSVGKGLESIQSNIDPLSKPSQQLQQYIEANIRWFVQDKDLGHSILSVYYFSNNHDELDKLRAAVEQQGIKRILTFLKQGAIANEWTDKDLPFKSRILHSILVGEVFKNHYSCVSIEKKYLTKINRLILSILK